MFFFILSVSLYFNSITLHWSVVTQADAFGHNKKKMDGWFHNQMFFRLLNACFIHRLDNFILYENTGSGVVQYQIENKTVYI